MTGRDLTSDERELLDILGELAVDLDWGTTEPLKADKIRRARTLAATILTGPPPDLTNRFPISHCRTCGARIIWAQTQDLRAKPVDADPHPTAGNLELFDRGPGLAPTAIVVPAVKRHGKTLYRSHFATCPQADLHRKPRKATPAPAKPVQQLDMYRWT